LTGSQPTDHTGVASHRQLFADQKAEEPNFSVEVDWVAYADGSPKVGVHTKDPSKNKDAVYQSTARKIDGREYRGFVVLESDEKTEILEILVPSKRADG